jgi:hypothetical protein
VQTFLRQSSVDHALGRLDGGRVTMTEPPNGLTGTTSGNEVVRTRPGASQERETFCRIDSSDPTGVAECPCDDWS